MVPRIVIFYLGDQILFALGDKVVLSRAPNHLTIRSGLYTLPKLFTEGTERSWKRAFREGERFMAVE